MVINDHELFYQTHGIAGGAAVLLLHHGLGSTRAWRRQVQPLVRAGFRVIAYDRWGYGKSTARPALGMPCFADDQADLLALLDRLEVEQASLVGHSDGGTIALYFAAAQPQRVARLVTIAAHIYVEPMMPLGMLGIRQNYENDGEFRQRFQRAHGDKYPQVFENWYTGWLKPEHRSWDMRPILRQISCPVLVIQGSKDEHARPQHAVDIAASIPGAELWIVPGAGHMLQREAAKELNRKLVEFLRPQTDDDGRQSSEVRRPSSLTGERHV